LTHFGRRSRNNGRLSRYDPEVRYREVLPCEALRDRVACFWTHASDGGTHVVLPDGAMDIVSRLGDGAGPAAMVVGTMTRAIVVPTVRPTVVIGVRFRPGAAGELLGVSARELRDEDAPLGDVWGRDGAALAERLVAARSVEDAIARLEAALCARRARAAAVDGRVARAVSLLRRAGGELPIGAVAAHVQLGERQLERLFDERVGIGPKAFARVLRMERALAAFESFPSEPWARIAVASGYTDQAHLTREFRALTGLTPVALAKARSQPQGPEASSSLPASASGAAVPHAAPIAKPAAGARLSRASVSAP
jgi:AraC-like DNA-binding protein